MAYKYIESSRKACKARRERLTNEGLCLCCAKLPQLPLQQYCKDCQQRRSERARTKLQERRVKLLEMYGEVCACCGESEPGFLTIDHKNNDGYKERTYAGKPPVGSFSFLNRYLKEKREDLQTLCYNCNCAKARLGYCPHKPEDKIGKRVRGRRRNDGEFNPASKLTVEQVLYIRASSDGYAELGRKFGVSEVAVRQAKLGFTWKNVLPPLGKEYQEEFMDPAEFMKLLVYEIDVIQ